MSPTSILRLDPVHRQLTLHHYLPPHSKTEPHGLSSWMTFETLARNGQVHNDVTAQQLSAAYTRPGGELDIWAGHVRLRGIQDPDRDQALRKLRSWTWERDMLFELGDLPQLLSICAAHQVTTLHPLPDAVTIQQVQRNSQQLEDQARARRHWLPLVTVSLYQQILLDIWERHLDTQVLMDQGQWAAQLVLAQDHSPDFAGLYSGARQRYRQVLSAAFSPTQTG